MFKSIELAGMMVFGAINGVIAGEYSEARSVMVYKTDQYVSEFITEKSISNIIELEIDPNGEAVFLDEIVVRISDFEVFDTVCVVAEKSDGVKREDEHRTIASASVDGEFVTLKNFNLGAFEETVRVEIALVSGALSDELVEIKVEVLDIKLVPQNSEVELAVVNMEETFTVGNTLGVDAKNVASVKAEFSDDKSLNMSVTSKKATVSLDKIFFEGLSGDESYIVDVEGNGEYAVDVSEIGIGSCELGVIINAGFKVKISLHESFGGKSTDKLDISKYLKNSDDIVIYSDIFSGHRVAVEFKEK